MSNISYVCAGLMLERASGSSYENLVRAYGSKLGIAFDFGAPNVRDADQPWGHTINNEPEEPQNNYKLDWLLPAGNINVTLPDYVKFIQEQMRKVPDTLSAHRALMYYHGWAMDTVHPIYPVRFDMGWFWEAASDRHITYHNLGNPGSFTTQVYMIPAIDRAYIIFTNSQNELTYAAVEGMMKEMKKRFGK